MYILIRCSRAYHLFIVPTREALSLGDATVSVSQATLYGIFNFLRLNTGACVSTPILRTIRFSVND